MPSTVVKSTATTAFLLGASLLGAQQNLPGTYADTHNPAGPASPAKIAQVWSVDPITGYLSINIPILNVAAPGRGPLVPYSLRYNSGATVELSSDVVPPEGPYDPDAGHTRFQWSGPSPSQKGPPAPWSENLRLLTWTHSGIPDDPVSGGTGCTIVGPYVFSDENGSHDLSVQTISGGTIGECSSPSITSAISTDGSTINTQLTTSSSYYPNGTWSAGRILYQWV